LLKKLANDEQSFSGATLRLSSIAVRGGDKAGARKLVDDVLHKQPGNVDALVARANLLLDDKMEDRALPAAEEAVKVGPHSASAHYALARAHRAKQDWDRAIAEFREVLKLNPRGTAARLELARLSLIKGKPDDAIQFARDALKEQPGLAEATSILGRAMLTKGDSRSAEPHVTQVAQAFPRSAGAQAELGRLYALQGQSKNARGAFEQALAIDSGNIDALSGLASLDVQAKNPTAARARVDARLAMNQNDPGLLLLAARLAMVVGDVKAAEQNLRKVIEIDPAQIDAYALLGQFYASQRRLDEARTEFEKVAKLNPPKSAVGAHIVVGMILQIQNRPAEAQARYEKVLSMDPTAAVAANNLAWIYAESGGNLDVALGLAQTAKSQLANSPEVSDTLGWIYYKKGLPNLAMPILRQNVDRSPANAMYQYHLGLACAKNGNTEEARKALKQALALDPKFAGAIDAQRVLAELKG
jgi:tetratricopeptide (TPR) repeat protein